MRVLIAIDESDCTEDILNFLRKQTWLDKAEFVILHVVQPLLVGSYMSVLPSPILAELVKEARTRGRSLVEGFAQKLRETRSEANVREMLREGFIADEITYYSKEWQADLIVIGSHSKPAIEKQILGSICLKVSCTAPCPVLIVRHLGGNGEHIKLPKEIEQEKQRHQSLGV